MVCDTEEQDVKDLKVLDSVSSYLGQIRAYPVLSQIQELELATRYKRTGNKRYGDRIICANLRIAAGWALDYSSRVLPSTLLDLIQESNLGLVVALEKFDPETGNRFSTYAKMWCLSYIRLFIRDNKSQVKLGTTKVQRKIYFGISKAKTELLKSGEEVTSENLARLLNVDPREISEMEQRLQGDSSLQSLIPNQEDVTLEDSIRDPNAVVREDQFSIHQQNIQEVLDRITSLKLSDRDRALLEQRIYCKNGSHPLTLQKFADNCGLTRERVRQLEVRLLERIRKKLSIQIHNEPELRDLFY